jgi:hypothetical protein
MLTDLAKDRDPFSGLGAAEGLTKRYPELKKSKAFIEKRSEAGLKGFEACFKMTYTGQECVDRFLGFIDADASNNALALQAAKVVRRNQNAYVAAPFFKRAIVDGKDPGCKDEDLKLSIVAALGLPSDDPRVGDAKSVAQTCWGALSDALSDELSRSAKASYYFQNACPILKEKKMLSNIQSKQCK